MLNKIIAKLRMLFECPVNIETQIEVFKGQLKKAAIVDCVKREFAECPNIKEADIIVEGADGTLLSKAKNYLGVNLVATKDFQMSYLLFISNEGKIIKVVAIITEGLEDVLLKLLEGNKYILRMIK